MVERADETSLLMILVMVLRQYLFPVLWFWCSFSLATDLPAHFVCLDCQGFGSGSVTCFLCNVVYARSQFLLTLKLYSYKNCSHKDDNLSERETKGDGLINFSL